MDVVNNVFLSNRRLTKICLSLNINKAIHTVENGVFSLNDPKRVTGSGWGKGAWLVLIHNADSEVH